MVTHQNRDAGPGTLAALYDDKRKQIGLGLYDPLSPIVVRVLHRGGPRAIDDALFAERVHEAAELREPLLRDGTDGYRVIYGEGDALPGLVVDRYGDTLVVKLYTAAWFARLGPVLDALVAQLSPRTIVLRLARVLQEHAPSPALTDGQTLFGPPPPDRVAFTENNLAFLADPLRGQKTGFFLDQRDNRRRVEQRAAGTRMLNVFSYSGGFSLYAARGGAREVTSLDLAKPALDDAERQFALNRPALGGAVHRTICADAFAGLRALAEQEPRYDLVVIDPPSFAKRREEKERALHSYARLCTLGLAVLAPGGQLVLASCSSRIDAPTFRATMLDAAAHAGRPLVVEEETGHAIDHPVGFADGAYLKCLFTRG